MEIGNSYSSYAAENTKEGNIITSTVELKTSSQARSRLAAAENVNPEQDEDGADQDGI